VTDPDLKEASRGRKKSLKAVINTLQDGKSSFEEKQQLLVKILAGQVNFCCVCCSFHKSQAHQQQRKQVV
jgi:AhpD family alkylhydroperoxidase